MVIVFLANKLISTDTIVPMMLALRRFAPTRAIRFYCFDAATSENIRRNVVLWDAIQELGEFVCLAEARRGWGRFRHRASMLGLLFSLSLRAIFGRAVFVHFKALNDGPFALLARLNRRRTFFVESNCWGYHKLMIEQVGNVGRQRTVGSWAGAGGTIIGFSPDWPALVHPSNRGKRKLVVPSSHLSGAWLDHVQEHAQPYLTQNFHAERVEPSYPYLVYILGYFGKFDFLAGTETMSELFEETLGILVELAGSAPILMKPHAITDLVIVQRAIERIRAVNPDARIVISHLHPTVLASRAAVFVANHYSTTLADASAYGVPTIEYTEYSAATLDITRGGSMRPEFVSHFINREPAKLRNVLAQALTADGSIRRPRAVDERLQPALELLAS